MMVRMVNTVPVTNFLVRPDQKVLFVLVLVLRIFVLPILFWFGLVETGLTVASSDYPHASSLDSYIEHWKSL